MRRCLYVGTLVLAVLIPGCSGPFPVYPGEVRWIGRTPRTACERTASDEPALRIHWLGAACYLISLDDVVLLTDPFVTYHSTLRVAAGRIGSDPRLVKELIGPLPVPRAVFIGHSHYDHLLDAAETLKLPGWERVPVYGSRTTQNILRGYENVSDANIRQTETGATWHHVGKIGETGAADRTGKGLSYKAIEAEHGPQLPCILLWPGHVEQPRTSPPTKAGDFRVGETYTYVFAIRGAPDGGGQAREFTVFFAGAATTPPLGFPDESIESVDVAILCVPGWKNITGYPTGIIRRLQPRYIVLAHFDDFLQTGRKRRRVIATADLDAFVRVVKEAANYERFEAIVMPDVGTTISFPVSALANHDEHRVSLKK